MEVRCENVNPRIYAQLTVLIIFQPTSGRSNALPHKKHVNVGNPSKHIRKDGSNPYGKTSHNRIQNWANKQLSNQLKTWPVLRNN